MREGVYVICVSVRVCVLCVCFVCVFCVCILCVCFVCVFLCVFVCAVLNLCVVEIDLTPTRHEENRRGCDYNRQRSQRPSNNHE